jgi:hypothetical protein
MDSIYQAYWNSLRKEKQHFWGMGDEITREVPIIYPMEPELVIGSIPNEISRANKIVEEGNYFIFNGKKKVRKIPFLSQLLPKKHMPKTENTSGRLFLTIDPNWILRCSDKRYTSWVSCFAPDGCYHFSAKEYGTSINIAMAMITNSEMTKMIGRRFVIIPSRHSNSETREEIVFFLRHYGTFPIHYQRSLSAFITEAVFDSNKDDWDIISKEDDCKAQEERILAKYVDNVGNAKFKSNGDKKIWFDDSAFVLRGKDAEIDVAYISFDSDEEDCEEDPDEVECDHCGECWDISDMFRVYYDDYRDCHNICESCFNDVAVLDGFSDEYIYVDEAIEFWHVDYRGNANYTAHTVESQIGDGLHTIRVIGGISNGELWDSDLLYADSVPNSCVEYDGEYLCVDIEDTDNSAILELIKEFEGGEDDEDEKEPEEVVVEAADEQRTTDS